MAQRRSGEDDGWHPVELVLAVVGVGGWLALAAYWLVHLVGPVVAGWARRG